MGDVARLLVQDGVLGPEDARRAVKAARGGDVASAALELRLADESALVGVLARALECPAVDLSRSVVLVAGLDAVGAEFCREHRVVPVSIGRIEVVLAMADPDDLPVADEVRFVTGKRVLRHAAVGTAVSRAIDGLERARREGAPAWRGERAPVLPDATSAHAAVVRPGDRIGPVEMPEATESMEIVGIADVMPFEMEAPTPVQPPASVPPPTPAPAPVLPPPTPLVKPPTPVVKPPTLVARAGRPTASPGPRTAPGPPAPRAPPRPGTARVPAPPPEPEPEPDVTLRLEGLAIGKVVLVADDDPEVRRLVAAVLHRMGCVVLEAPDGTVAMEMVREARPDLVVLDAMMPGLHGFEVCRMIKGDRALRATRVVLCSAIYRGTVGVDAQQAFGADAFVEKPFRLEELTRVFKVALVGPVAAETDEERGAREEGIKLWRAASEALSADRVPEAADLARQAAAKDPWSAEAHYYLGHALSKQGMLYEAVAAYERSAELRPDVDASHQCLAQAYEKLGFQKSAREAWGRAVETCKDPVRKKAMQARLMKLLGV